MATIRRRGNTWEVQVRLKGHEPISATFTKKVLADDWAIQKEAEIKDGRHKDSRAASKALLSDLFDQYEKHVLPTHEPSSHVPDKSRLGHLRRFCQPQNLTLAGLTIDHVLEYVDLRLPHVSSDAIRKELSLWSDVIESARSLWKLHIVANPVDNTKRVLKKLRKLKAGNERKRRLQPGEYEKIRDAKHSHFTLINQVAMFAIETAMRQGEIAGARREHVDLENQLIRVPKTKTDWATGDSGRTVPLSSVAVAIIQSLPVSFIDGSLFGMHSDSIKRAFSRLCKQHGIKGLRFHDLRREAVSRLFERGLAVEEVALISGHKTWSQLKRYTALRAEDLVKKLG